MHLAELNRAFRSTLDILARAAGEGRLDVTAAVAGGGRMPIMRQATSTTCTPSRS